MATTQQSKGLRGSGKGVFTTKRRQAGTSLVEILVVIVIFLIGILAVVQVFPRGFRLLLVSRNNSAATAIGRDEVERIKANPQGVPDEILAVDYVNGVPTVNETLNPLDLGPRGDSIDSAGTLYKGGQRVVSNWMLASGPNLARHIVGEGARVPAPRIINKLYGGLMVLEHGPINSTNPLVAYANDMTRNLDAPREASRDTTIAVLAVKQDNSSQSFGAKLVKTPVTTAPFEYFVVNPASIQASLLLPTANYARSYRIRLSAYLGSGAGYQRTEFPALTVRVPAVGDTATYPLVEIRLAKDGSGDGYHQGNGLLDSLGLTGGGSLGGIEYDTVRVAPQYLSLPAPPTSGDDLAAWNNDPFRMYVSDPVLGCVVFSPAARESVVQRPGGVSEPLLAKVDYDVYDWRILREDFRSVGGNATFDLALQGLKVGSQTGIDGLANSGLFRVSNNIDPCPVTLGDPNYPRDNVAVIDLTTGFEVQEYNTGDQVDGKTLVDVPTSYSGYDPAKALIRVDKSRGVVTLVDANPGGGGQVDVRLIVPKELGGGVITADAANRTFRVLYKARNEWSVQPIKAASQYTRVNTSQIGAGNYLIGGGAGGGDASRLYFPASDIGRKVTIDRIVYRTGGGDIKTVEGQDFLIQKPGPTDTSTFGYVSIADLVGDGQARFVQSASSGPTPDPVQGVKGASLAVRVLWNPETFQLGADSQANISKLEQWGRSWRRSTTETYLRAEETR